MLQDVITLACAPQQFEIWVEQLDLVICKPITSPVHTSSETTDMEMERLEIRDSISILQFSLDDKTDSTLHIEEMENFASKIGVFYCCGKASVSVSPISGWYKHHLLHDLLAACQRAFVTPVSPANVWLEGTKCAQQEMIAGNHLDSISRDTDVSATAVTRNNSGLWYWMVSTTADHSWGSFLLLCRGLPPHRSSWGCCLLTLDCDLWPSSISMRHGWKQRGLSTKLVCRRDSLLPVIDWLDVCPTRWVLRVAKIQRKIFN